MSLAEHVSLTITQDTVGVARAGFGVPMILSVNASFPERIRFYTALPDVADDGFATTSPEYLAAEAMFSQTPKPEMIAIGRAAGQPTQAYRIDVSSVTLGGAYGINVEGEGVTSTEVRYTTLVDQTFVGSNAGDLATAVAHGMSTGDGPYRVSNSGGALPTGLAVDTDYWIIKLTADTYQFATSKANALALTAIVLSSDGTGTQTLRRNQNDVICAQLVQGLNAVVGKNFTAAQVTGAGETDYVTVTGNAAGEWFSLEVTSVSLLKNTQTHAEPATTLATDLAAIQDESDAWYALYTLYNSEAYLKAAAAWINSQKKIYIGDISDSETVTLAAAGTGSSDAADDIHVLAYSRTALMYHPSPANMTGAAWLGRVLPLEPGSESWKGKTLEGVTPVTLTATHRVNLRAKKCNTYQTVAGLGITWEGTTADGDFVDVTRGLDWLEDDMTKAVFEAIVGSDKIAYTDQGVAQIEGVIRGSLEAAVSRGILAADPAPNVEVPKVATISSANKALRLLPDVKFSATLAGAIHKVDIDGVVSV